MAQAEGYGGGGRLKPGTVTNQDIVKRTLKALGNPSAYKPTGITTQQNKPTQTVTNKPTNARIVDPPSNNNPSYIKDGIEYFVPTSVNAPYQGLPSGYGTTIFDADDNRDSGGRSSYTRPELRSAASMAELAGINYDQAYIRKIMEDAVEKQYANLDTEYGRTQDMFYDVVANNADMLMGAMRRGDRDAVIAGTAGGTQAAGELSAMLGISKEHAQGATELAQSRSDLIAEREAAIAKVAVDALKYYNDLGINLMTLSNSELNALVTAYASEVATEGGIYNTDVLAGVERDRIANELLLEQIRSEDRGLDRKSTEGSAAYKGTTSYGSSGGSGSRSYSSGGGSKVTTPDDDINLDLIAVAYEEYDNNVRLYGQQEADMILLKTQLAAGALSKAEFDRRYSMIANSNRSEAAKKVIEGKSKVDKKKESLTEQLLRQKKRKGK